MNKERNLYLIKGLFLVFLSFALIPQALGSVKSLNEDISELELEKEVEDQELFDEYALANEEKKLDKDLKGQTKELQNKINKLNREKQSASKKHDQLTKRRKLSESIYNRVSVQASKVEKIRNKEVEKTQQLEARVNKF